MNAIVMCVCPVSHIAQILIDAASKSDHPCPSTPENLLLYYQEHVERSSDLQKTWKREKYKKRNIPTRMH